MLTGWSWWQIVATVGVLWTATSFLVALALGRVLRANLAFDVDGAERTPEPESGDDEGDDDSGAEWVGPTLEPSLLDQLLPAELAGDNVSRSSGTRFNPVPGQSNVEQLRGRRRIG
jgi:hypothetical protein